MFRWYTMNGAKYRRAADIDILIIACFPQAKYKIKKKVLCHDVSNGLFSVTVKCDSNSIRCITFCKMTTGINTGLCIKILCWLNCENKTGWCQYVKLQWTND